MKFYDKKFAEAYDKRLTEEGYPGRLLKVVGEQLEGYQRVIDVGAGSGFFTVPLAKNGHHVTAVEPSPHMMRLLQKKLDSTTRPRVTAVQSTWEEADVAGGDAVICIHAVYPMKDLSAALLKMCDAAPLRMVLVRNEAEMDTLSDRIRQEFSSDRCGSDYLAQVRSVLSGNGIPYKELPVHERREIFFHDLDKEAENYCGHLDIDPAKVKEVARLIESQCEYDGKAYRFTSFLSDIIFVF